ncbi:putative conserved membrane protein [Synechococcus sp. PROS-9-1]|uniref:hypothetical protein n=1 Tax=Synechococcus sp. PROS-9-1 TaxID=1968775 RepID=UPI001649640B|nr:hypothetical protein [Synechococcus sp. PROS-9-1]QNJ31949.1 putative conserved membrane protein [Synechococcus sp. PROS-9-1]
MKHLLPKLIAPLFAAIGVFGLAGSGIVWNFLGRSLGLPSTVISLLALLVGLVLLRPLAPTTASVSTSTSTSAPSESELKADELKPSTDDIKPAMTTAESIAQELADSQELVESSPPVNFAPVMLLPGQGLRDRRRRPGASLKRYKSMAGELFEAK